MYSYDQVMAETLSYFNGNELSANVFINKYALRDDEGNLLESNPDQMHWRIAKEFARIEKNKFQNPLSEDDIYGYIKQFKRIIPQGSPMYGIGNPKAVSLSNCFVINSPYDSYGGIIYSDQEIAQISKRRGGVGIDISTLRPNGMPVQNAAQTTTGAVSFMHRYSNTCREVGQNGRRGALMISISVHHPDIQYFATIKNDDKSVTGANISVRLTDEFMKAVCDDTDYELRWNGTVYDRISARDMWKTIIHSAWFRAEPGLLFWDRILEESPADCYELFKTISTNPCGEVPLSMYDSCRLLVLNLFDCVVNPYTYKAEFDYLRLYETAGTAQRLMDDLVDLEIEKIKQIIDKVKNDPQPDYIKDVETRLWDKVLKAATAGRRTGTGATALGDVIAALGLKYGSTRSIEVTEEIYKTLKLGCYRSSVDMAKELGSFESYSYELEKDNPFINRIKEEDNDLYLDMMNHGRRNIACLTSAPTGSTSMMAKLNNYFSTTSGIEPCPGVETLRNKKINPNDTDIEVAFVDDMGDSWAQFEVNHAGVDEWLKVNDKDVKESPYHGSCCNDIDWKARVKLQAAAQRHVDHSISSTVNLPSNATEEDVATIYEAAWQAGCKGMTVYRDECRTGVIVSKEKKDKRPRELPCDVHHITVKGQQYFVLVGLLDDKPYEVFAGKNGFLPNKIKSGTIIRKRKDFYKAVFDDNDTELSPITMATEEMEDIITRLTSGLLRTGADMHFIVRQLEKVGERQTEMNSFARSVARALKKYIPDGTKESSACPECTANSLVRQEGCVVCTSCGWSKCI
jgi:ribonucleoside-diphosphate reductase alpha chain